MALFTVPHIEVKGVAACVPPTVDRNRESRILSDEEKEKLIASIGGEEKRVADAATCTTEYKIVEGELWLRSKTQIMGYLNFSMERFTEDGWFKTGDMVETTADGYIKIVGRNKEIINVGGEKVLPSEVESVLFQMPGVLDCLVYPENNPITGQMVVAKILFKEPMKPSEAKRQVTDFCKIRLAKYKIPVKVVLMTESEYSERFKKKRV